MPAWPLVSNCRAVVAHSEALREFSSSTMTTGRLLNSQAGEVGQLMRRAWTAGKHPKSRFPMEKAGR
jgi:hypothetical protein